ncbi:MAG: hypothetical protein QOC62_4787 [Mycobacterium sp.]|jgi:hypothetical protein|nr:hypothetical protein [Mycobacterium sp.]
MTTTRMIASGAAVLVTLMLIGDALVAAIVIGLAGLTLFLLTMSSAPQRRAKGRAKYIDGSAGLGGEKTTGPPRRGRSRPKRILVFHQF